MPGVGLSILTDGFWLTAGWALIMALISQVGYKTVGTKLLEAYAWLFNREEYRRFIDAWRALRTARQCLTEISAQDEFARWARQQRVVDKLQGEFDRLNGQRQRALLAKQMGLALVLRVVLGLVTAWWLGWRIRSTPVAQISTDTFGPVAWLMALPRLSQGFVSGPFLFTLTTLAINRIIALSSAARQGS